MKFILSFLISLFIISNIYSQISVSGIVRDSASNEFLIGAFVKIGDNITITNGYGNYSLKIKKGTYNIEISYVGYKTLSTTIEINDSHEINFNLSPISLQIDRVVVYSDNSKNYLLCKQLPVSQIMKTPTSFGEPDVIKVMQQQPGIKNIGDGSSSLYVRGGNRDQNLIYIDEASMYSISHMYGFVSICNPILLKDVKFYNSYIPAEYGGRISSVLDMKLKEGNNKRFSSNINISTLSTNIGLEGPIKKDKSSFFIAARNSNLNYILQDLNLPLFRDIIAKTNFELNKKNSLYISTYYSIDKNIQKELNTGIIQNNNSITTRWTYKPQSSLFINTSFITNNYSALSYQDSIQKIDGTTKSITWETGVIDYALKSKIDWILNSNNRLNLGYSSIYHKFKPGIADSQDLSMSNLIVLENAVFVEENLSFSKLWKCQLGLRYMTYQNFGNAFWYSYNENHIPISKHIEDKGVWNSFQSIEPRIRISYSKQNSEIAIAYTKTSQGMQVLSNNALSYSNMETWLPLSPNIKPIVSNNISLGYTYSTNKYGVLIESYYKKIQNQIDYIDHAQLFGNPYIESQIRTGTAIAYGIETSLQKKQGKNTGQISYTYSRSIYTIPEITSKDTYRSPYDLPHDVKIQITHYFSSQFNIIALWVFMSGRPTTVPIGGVYYEYSNSKSDVVPIYSERNKFSYPNYDRLDLSCNYKFTEKKHIEQSISFTFFNAYGKKNPMYYDINFDSESYIYYSFKFMPSLSYKAKIF